MAADLLTDVARMAGAGLTVAAVAGPVGVGCWRLARRFGEPLGPPPAGWRVPWAGYDLLGVMIGLIVVSSGVAAALNPSGFFRTVYGPEFPPPVELERLQPDVAAAIAGAASPAASHAQAVEATTVRGLWAGALALPLQLLSLWAARRALFPGWRPPRPAARAVPARVALGVLGWLALSPIVFAAHFATIATFHALGWGMDEHPLTRLGPWRPAVDHALFVFQACVAAPVVEELSFRGVLLPWLLGGSVRPAGLRQWGRVWVVLIAAITLAALFTGDDLAKGRVRGAVVFAVALAAGWVAVSRLTTKTRTWGAVWASAALFAAVHTSVWPSPVPLFVLGLGLGWLAVRTRGILVPVIVHGLFNAVSVVYVLSGS